MQDLPVNSCHSMSFLDLSRKTHQGGLLETDDGAVFLYEIESRHKKMVRNRKRSKFLECNAECDEVDSISTSATLDIHVDRR